MHDTSDHDFKKLKCYLMQISYSREMGAGQRHLQGFPPGESKKPWKVAAAIT